MRVFYFTEQPYPEAWADVGDSIRVTPPNSLLDPKIAADRYEDYIDLWVRADELGLNVMVNEHHSTATCISPSCTVTLGILARVTKNARLLALGVPLPNRPDPVRVAEELSMIDVISRGRLEMGFVKSVVYETAVALTNPNRMMDRLWESHDLIIKAMTTHDGPFSWEGQYFQYRNVNIWPRPYQDPHPPVWITGQSPGSMRAIAERDYRVATLFTGYGAKTLFNTYRNVRAEMGHATTNIDRFGYSALLAVAKTEAEAHRRAEILAGYLRNSSRVREPFNYMPGYFSSSDTAKRMAAGPNMVAKEIAKQDGTRFSYANASVQDLIDAGCLFAGTPAQVEEQILSFADAVGGFGNLLLMGHGAFLSQEDAMDSLTLFGQDVLPKLTAASTSTVSSEGMTGTGDNVVAPVF